MSHTLPALKAFKLLCFDCYGTIVDWENGINDRLQPLFKRSPKSREWNKKESLEAYLSVELQIQIKYPTKAYSEILELCYKELAERLEINYEGVDEDAKIFGSSVPLWKPFPDSIQALVKLRKHFKMVILSNIDKASFAATAQILKPFEPDLVITAQEIGSYKPNEQNFHYMLDAVKKAYGVESSEVLVTAQSLLHDHQPANALGLKSAWIAREGAAMGVGEVVKNVKYDYKFDTLGEMAAVVEST